MHDKSVDENSELQQVAMSDSTAEDVTDLDTETISGLSYQVLGNARSAVTPKAPSHNVYNSSSEDGSDSSQDGSDNSLPNTSPATSPDSLQTKFPDNNALKANFLFDESQKSQSNLKSTAAVDIVSEFDPEPETVYVSASQGSSDTASDENFGFDELCAISEDCLDGAPGIEATTVWHGCPDTSPQYCDLFYKVGSGNFSPDSSTSSSDTGQQSRRPKGSQCVLAYASPVQDGRRIRTSCDRNDDTGMWHIELGGFINEAKRVGGPYLCSLPMDMADMDGDDPLRNVMEDFSLFQQILSLFEEHKIHPTSVMLKNCKYRFDPEDEPIPTLIIQAARDCLDCMWLQAYQEIRRILCVLNLGRLNIDIMDPAMSMHNYSWPLCQEGTVSERANWRKVDHTSFCELRPDCSWAGGFYHIGSSSNKEESLLMYHLVVNHDYQRDWRIPRDVIAKVLDDSDLSMVGVLVTKYKRRNLSWSRYI